jgi:hypothetical protein
VSSAIASPKSVTKRWEFPLQRAIKQAQLSEEFRDEKL